MKKEYVKAVVFNDGFEYEVEFRKTTNHLKCCDRKSIRVNIKMRTAHPNPFKGFSKRHVDTEEEPRQLTYGYFCPICGISYAVKAKSNVNTCYDWRNATKDVDEAVRKAWLSLQK